MRRKRASSPACYLLVEIICLGRVRIEPEDRPCSAGVVVGEDATGAQWYTVKRHAGLASDPAIGRQRRRRRKSAKVQLPTDDCGKTIDDGSSSGTLSTPCSFGNCLMPVVELDAARLVGGSEADRSRVLERVDEYLEANASFDWGQLSVVVMPCSFIAHSICQAMTTYGLKNLSYRNDAGCRPPGSTQSSAEVGRVNFSPRVQSQRARG